MKITLKAARVNKSMTQIKAAEAVGVTRDTISNWEREKCYPDAKNISRIEEVYGVKYDDILFFAPK